MESRDAVDEWSRDAVNEWVRDTDPKRGDTFRQGAYHAAVVTRDWFGWMHVRVSIKSEEQPDAPLCYYISYTVKEGKIQI
jgi:hypothetical protein